MMCSAIGTHIFRSAVRAAAGIDCLMPVEMAGQWECPAEHWRVELAILNRS